MKHRPRRRFAIALITTATATALIGALSSCGSDFEHGPYLRGLKEHYEKVTSRLVAQGVRAHRDDDSWTVIEDGAATYTASEYGVQWIDTDHAFISDIGTPKHGKIASFSVSVGGGYDAAKAGYALNDRSHPEPAHWHDDPDWVLSTIRAAISTDEMKTLIAQAEHYQRLMKTALDELE